MSSSLRDLPRSPGKVKMGDVRALNPIYYGGGDLCVIAPDFDWATFTDFHLGVTSIQDTLSNTSLDNVQFVVKLLGTDFDDWKTEANNAGVDIAGTIGCHDDSYQSVYALTTTLGGPDFANGSIRAQLKDVGAYADFIANKVVSFNDTLASAFTAGVMTLPGIATTGLDDYMEFQCHPTVPTNEVQYEVSFANNPDATNTERAYPGVTYYYFNGGDSFFTDGDGSDIDDYREGIWDFDADVTDPAFDGSTMRAGLWIRKGVAGTFDISFIINGAIIVTFNMAYTAGLASVAMDFQFYSQSNAVTGTLAETNISYFEVNTDLDFKNIFSVIGSDPADYTYQIDLGCTKWAAWCKPNAANTVTFEYANAQAMMTDPAYLGSGATEFETVAVYDGFASADGTKLPSHTGEVGATWTVNSTFGAGDGAGGGGSTFYIYGSALRRADEGVDTGATPGESLAYASGTVAGITGHISITFPVIFTIEGTTAGYVSVYQNADTGTVSGDKLCRIGTAGIVLGAQSIGFTPTTGIQYNVRLDINGTNLSLFVNGVQQGTTENFGSAPAEPFGVSMLDASSGGDQTQASISSFKIAELNP